ncbi:hypothetical protein M3Y95_01233900 [Aphelenchoides besseyi]|nr:hypothetical protein M3Y95_01233900 [Aphelenchoides besseyi]
MFVWNNRTEKIAVFWLLKDGSVCMPDGQVSGLDYDKATFMFNYNGYSFARFVYSDEVMKQIFKLPNTRIVNEASQLNLLYEEKWLTTFNYQMDLQKLLRKILVILRKPTSKRFDFPDMNISSMRWKTLLQKFTVDSNGTLSPQMADQAHDLLDDKDIWNMQCSWDATDYRCGHYNKRHLQSAVMNNFTDSRAVGRKMFEEFVKSCANANDFAECNKIPSDSRMAVYCAGMIDETPEHFAFMDRYKSYIREMMDIYGLFHDEFAYITEGLVC